MNAATKSEARCRYRSPSGRRCRNNSLPNWKFCNKHAGYYYTRAAADDIVSRRERLDTAEGIHEMMARVARGLAAGEVPPRRAATLFYGGRAMLYSLRHLREERNGVFLANEEDLWRDKVLADSHHDKLNCVESSPDDDEDGDGQ